MSNEPIIMNTNAWSAARPGHQERSEGGVDQRHVVEAHDGHAGTCCAGRETI